MVKTKILSIRCGLKFDAWMKKMRDGHKKSTEEDNYVDMLEILKNNDAITDYVNRTMID